MAHASRTLEAQQHAAAAPPQAPEAGVSGRPGSGTAVAEQRSQAALHDCMHQLQQLQAQARAQLARGVSETQGELQAATGRLMVELNSAGGGAWGWGGEGVKGGGGIWPQTAGPLWSSLYVWATKGAARTQADGTLTEEGGLMHHWGGCP